MACTPAARRATQYRLLPFRSPYAKQLFDYGHELAAKRREDPRDDLVSKLVTWEDDDGRRLTEQEFDTMFLLLVVAGNETTRQSIAHGLQALMEHPEAMQRMRSDPEVMKTAVEEIMRWSSPVIHFRRTATVDTELNGVSIKAGDKVVVWLISGNYDERQFEHPYTFDITRKPNRHVTFGRGGPHFCLGAHLAVLETRVMFEELLPRIAAVEPTAQPRRLESNFTNAFKSMPVRVRPLDSAILRGRIGYMTDSSLQLLIDQGVTTVRLAYPDLHGIARGKEFPAGYFQQLMHDGAPHCEAIMTVDLQHNVISGFEHGFQDIVARPVESTLARLPWDPEVAWMLGDLERMDGSPYGVDSRAALKLAVARFVERGLVAGDGPGARVLPVRAGRRRRRRVIVATSTIPATCTRSVRLPIRAGFCGGCCTPPSSSTWARLPPTMSSAGRSSRST